MYASIWIKVYSVRLSNLKRSIRMLANAPFECTPFRLENDP